MTPMDTDGPTESDEKPRDKENGPKNEKEFLAEPVVPPVINDVSRRGTFLSAVHIE